MLFRAHSCYPLVSLFTIPRVSYNNLPRVPSLLSYGHFSLSYQNQIIRDYWWTVCAKRIDLTIF